MPFTMPAAVIGITSSAGPDRQPSVKQRGIEASIDRYRAEKGEHTLR